MNSQQPAAGPRNDRDIEWMEETFPLRQDWIEAAIEELTASNASASLRRKPTPWQQEKFDQSDTYYARVTGPVAGYYIASYACRDDIAGRTYTGDYKICDLPPSSYWTAQSLFVGSCRHTEGTGVKAMASAEAAAQRMIADMPIRIDRA
jgi:hypothetical protein